MSVRKFSLIIAVMTVLFLLSPAYGEETTGMAVNPNGKVGVGTDTPVTKLHIYDPALQDPNGQGILTLDSSYWGPVPGSGGRIVFRWNQDGTEAADIRGYTYGIGETGLSFGTGWGNVQPRMFIDNSGNVGIGTDTPAAKLHVNGDVKIDGDINMPDDFGIYAGVDPVIGTAYGELALSTELYYYLIKPSILIDPDFVALIDPHGQDNQNWNVIALERDGYAVISPYLDTVFDDGSNVGINTFVFGDNASAVLGIANGTAPTSSPPDMVQLYAKNYNDGDGTSTSELFVRDEDGNVTDLSPHIFALFTPDEDEALPWAYYSENDYIGKRINVDMAGAIRALEKLTGKKFIYYEDIPKVDPLEGKKEAWEKRWIRENTVEVEIDKNAAFETVEIEIDDTTNVIGEDVSYKLEGTEVIQVKKPKYSKKKVKKVRLKKNVKFDSRTGKFILKQIPTVAEAEEAAQKEFQIKLKRFVRDRM